MAPHVKREKGHYRGGGAPKGNQNAKGNKGGTGRPTLYRETHIAVARYVASMGGLDHALADALDVDVQTVWAWKRKYPEFAAATVVTDEEKLAAVRKSLFHRATGYTFDSEKIFSTPAGILRAPCREHLPPDVAALKYYLNNKSRGEYAEKSETEARHDVTVRIEGGLPTEDEP